MTPESIQLAQEITEAAIFDAGERRTECIRQVDMAEEMGRDVLALHGEGQRLAERIKALRKLECELKQESAGDGGGIFS